MKLKFITKHLRQLQTFVRREKPEKQEEPDYNAIAIQEFMDFKKIGETFKYMGIEMIVTKHYETKFYPYSGLIFFPGLHADYVDKNGKIHSVSFGHHELETLKQQNT